MRLFLLLSFLLSQSAFSQDFSSVTVANTNELVKAVHSANQNGFTEIILADGLYLLKNRLSFKKDHIRLVSASGKPKNVIIRGKGMVKHHNPEILIDVYADFVTISGVTLEQSGNHLIQVRAEADADYFTLTNSILRDSYEQMLKVSGEKGGATSDFGQVSHSLFEYSAGIGPQYYIGGIDAHNSKSWLVENNTFRDIASPGKHIAQHAVHFWNGSSKVRVLGNTVINCDRGIGFGLGQDGEQHRGGEISRNVIIHTDDSDPYADVGIVLESSPGTIIDGNSIFLHNGYSNAIEFRFPQTQGVVISNNVTNKRIKGLDGAQADLFANRSVGSLLSIFK